MAFLLSTGVRLAEYARWDPAQDKVGDEFLLTTNDAYAWAGAAADPGHPMAILLRLGAPLLALSPANLAFWMAALLGGLVAIPIALWGFHLGYVYVVLPVAVFGSLIPAFFTRSRLGFYDTDWSLLFFPLLIGWLLARWLGSTARTESREDLESSRSSGHPLSLYALVLVLAGSVPWHGSIRLILLALLWITLLLVRLQPRMAASGREALALIGLSLALTGGWPGLLLGLGAAWISSRLREPLRTAQSPRLLWIVLAGLLIGLTALQVRNYLLPRMEAYLQLVGPTTGSTLTYPDATASVSEIQRPGPADLLAGIGFVPVAGAIGLLGFAFVARRRPDALLILPMTILGVASLASGARFAMLAGPAVAVGWLPMLELPFSAAGRPRTRSPVVLGAIGLVTLGSVWGVADVYGRLPVEPILSQQHARTLHDLRGLAAPDAIVWTWWDFGYATEYLTGRQSFVEGGRTSGESLFVLGMVLGGDDPDRSAQMIRYTALQGQKPWRTWEFWTPEEMDAWVDDLGPPASVFGLTRQQYLVSSWDAIPLLSWIQYYGAWDFSTASSTPGQVARERFPLEFDPQVGVLTTLGGSPIDVRSADLIGASVQHLEYPANLGPRALVNLASGEVLLLDERGYRSTLVQLLVRPAAWIEAETPFRLVVDGLPAARVFRLP